MKYWVLDQLQVRCAGSIEQAREQHARECAKLGIGPWQNKAGV